MGRPAAAGAALARGHEVLLSRPLAIQLGDLAPVARLPLLDPAAHAGPALPPSRSALKASSSTRSSLRPALAAISSARSPPAQRRR